jgi:methyl coenzyme M reductase subunit D
MDIDWELPTEEQVRGYGLVEIGNGYYQCPECSRPIYYKSDRCKYCLRIIKPTKLALKLKKRIESIEGFTGTVFPYIFRLRTGRWQKSAGAWSFEMKLSDRTTEWFEDVIGSCETANDIAKAKKLVIYKDEVMSR